MDCRTFRLDGLAYSDIWCSFLTLPSSLKEWQHLVGVVQRNQPCLRDHAMCEAPELRTHTPLTKSPCWLQKVRSAFSISSLDPLLFSAATDLHWTSRGANSSYCFLMLCNKLLVKSSYFCVLFFSLNVLNVTVRSFRMAFPLGKWVLCWWKRWLSVGGVESRSSFWSWSLFPSFTGWL